MFAPGQTALVLPVPQAEPVVGRWRERYDPSATLGAPAHVTIVFPWLPLPEVDATVLADLTTILGGHEPLRLVFRRVGRFPGGIDEPGALWLAPEPADGCRALVRSVVARWPQAPPYGGRVAVDDVVPHLTVAQAEPAVLDEAAAAVAAGLPVAATVDQVLLMAFTDDRWGTRAALPLGTAGSG